MEASPLREIRSGAPEPDGKVRRHVGQKRANEVRNKGEELIARRGLISTILELFGTEQPEDRAEDAFASTVHAIQIGTNLLVRPGKTNRKGHVSAQAWTSESAIKSLFRGAELSRLTQN